MIEYIFQKPFTTNLWINNYQFWAPKKKNNEKLNNHNAGFNHGDQVLGIILLLLYIL